MILRPIKYQSPAERDALRPKAGDEVVVAGSGKKYVVLARGSRYYRLRAVDSGELFMAPVQDVTKYIPPPSEPDDDPVAHIATGNTAEELDREFNS